MVKFVVVRVNIYFGLWGAMIPIFALSHPSFNVGAAKTHIVQGSMPAGVWPWIIGMENKSNQTENAVQTAKSICEEEFGFYLCIQR